MNISFDLDSTLIPYEGEFETERKGFFAKMIGVENIRRGAPQLISELKKQGHKIHIYTTSFRSKRKIRQTLRCYGISVGTIVTQKQNEKRLKSLHISASKYPPAFGFDMHIDDLEGVGIEAKKLDFSVIIVKPQDQHWCEYIKSLIK